ncbi:tripartite motif-containing protein 2-like isoform X2 [Sycon ciliatum]|uniref:tripartite motif-containing protein 2-like isoform X2 n=1 Tax=Sycon ciliatum TaxID=27933 RepID=UPI0031F68478
MAIKPPGSMPWRKSPFQRKGYPPEIFQDENFREKKYLCSHCHQVLDQPRSGPCGHRYCRLCLEDRIDRMRPTAECYWKDCQAVLKPAKLVDEKDLANELEEQTVKCDSGPCEWSGSLRDYVKHEEECQYGYSCCPFGCDVKTPRPRISRHYKQHALLHQDLQTAEQQTGVIDQLKTEVEKVQHDVDAMQKSQAACKKDVTVVRTESTRLSRSVQKLHAEQLKSVATKGELDATRQDSTQSVLDLKNEMIAAMEESNAVLTQHAEQLKSVATKGELDATRQHPTQSVLDLKHEMTAAMEEKNAVLTQNLKITATKDELAAVSKEATRVSKSVLEAKHGAAAAMERSNEALAQMEALKRDIPSTDYTAVLAMLTEILSSVDALTASQQSITDKTQQQFGALSQRLEKGEQDTTAACQRIVEMQNQTNTTVRQLQEQNATTSTSIGQLLEEQQDTSDKVSRVSAAVTTIQQVQSDMRSDLEGKIAGATQNHYRSIHNNSSSFGSKGNGREQFTNPYGITISNDGTVFIADFGNHRVKITTLDGTYIRDIGKLGSGNAEFKDPTDVAVDDDGDLVVVEYGNRRLQVLHQDGSYVKTIGNGMGESHGVAALSLPQHGICYAVTDLYDHCVRVFTKGGRQLNKFGTKGSGPGQFNGPQGIISSDGRLLVVDIYNHRIQVFTTDGNFITMFGSEGESDGQLKHPRYIAEDRHGHFLVTEEYNHRVQVFTSDTFSHVATFGSRSCLSHPNGIAVSPSGTVYVSNWGKDCITMF